MKKEVRQKIRENYKRWKPRSSPYDYYDWFHVFTPIENNVWSDIRYLGLPFYPQFPILGYFIDFADPIKKIGIEVDGKMWHLNKAKDEKRQRELEKEGWEIIRIEGWRTYKEREDFITEQESFELSSEEYEDELLRRGYYECSEGILLRLKGRYTYE